MKRILTFLLIFSLAILNISALAFSDVDENHFAKDEIDTLYSLGAIKGYEDGTFRPEGFVTRAEFAKIISPLFEFKDTLKTHFTDLEGHWAKDYAYKTSAYVYNDGSKFYPDTYATRGEIAYTLSKLLNLKKSDLSKVKDFTDFESANEAFKPHLASMVDANLLKGYEDSTLRPDGFVTRAECCALIIRALGYKDEVKDNENKDDEIKDEEIKDEEIKDDTEKETIENHLYTLHPLKEVLVINEVTSVINPKTDSEAIRLKYFMASFSETIYETIIDLDEEITVFGSKNSLESLSKGDVFLTSSAFLNRIDAICVLASFDEGISDLSTQSYYPTGTKIGEIGSGKDYEVVTGKVISKERKTKSTRLVLETSLGEKEVYVPNSLDGFIYTPRLNVSLKSASASKILKDEYVFIRFTDGVATEFVATSY